MATIINAILYERRCRMATNRTTEGIYSIIYYRRWAKMLRPLPADLRLSIYDAICDYLIDCSLPADPVIRYSAFAAILADINEDKAKHAQTCQKRSEAGRKGAEARYGKR